MNYFNYSQSKLKRKFRLTTLQLSALVILPLFVFALITKVKEKKETESSSNEIVVTQSMQQEKHIIYTVSQSMTQNSESVEDSNSAK